MMLMRQDAEVVLKYCYQEGDLRSNIALHLPLMNYGRQCTLENAPGSSQNMQE